MSSQQSTEVHGVGGAEGAPAEQTATLVNSDRAWLVGAWLMALLVLLVALAEISRMSGDLLDQFSRSWALNELMGPGRLLNHSTAGWTADYGELFEGEYDRLRHIYLLVDVLFVATYWVGLRRLVAGSTFGRILVNGLATADLLENALAYGRLWPGVIVWLSALKWAFVLVLAGWLVYRRRVGLAKRLHDAATTNDESVVWMAVKLQAFSILAVLPIAVLVVVPRSGVFDQLPDVQRRWFDHDEGQFFAAAVVTHALLVVAIFLMGRVRYRWALRAEADEREQANLFLWILGPILLVGFALAAKYGFDMDVVRSRLLVFCAIPLTVVLVSLWFRLLFLLCRGRWLVEPRHRKCTAAEADVVKLVGDVITVAGATLAGVGLVRSMTAPAVLGIATTTEWVALICGAILAPVGWLLAPWLISTIDPWAAKILRYHDATAMESREDRYPMGITVMIFLALVLVMALTTFPLQLTTRLGALAVTTLALLSLTVLLGAVTALIQDTKPPEVFWLPSSGSSTPRSSR